ncbi:FkbM family methyltransferase [Rosistilla oblonga]|uniref:FkbM family methyltransferase n=1 Tax=Rosistilla oblonga TaxID=2527990 RepID=UPI003A9690F3
MQKKMLSNLKRKCRRLLKHASGRYRHLEADVRVGMRWCGSLYGGFYVCHKCIPSNAIVYSFGIGEDVSFDQSMIRDFGCRVYGFDPTPRSAEWVRRQDISRRFSFFEFGLGERCGSETFFLPRNSHNVSGSFVLQGYVDSSNAIKLEMKDFATICRELGHNQVDVLKMDIEGAEYDVLESVVNSGVRIDQLLIEFHDRFFDDGLARTKAAVAMLKDSGFQLFGASDSLEELSFIHRSVVSQASRSLAS